MIAALGVPVTLCTALGGETGHVLRHLVVEGGLTLESCNVAARDVGGEPLSRHDLDALYERTLVQGIEAGMVVLAGPTMRAMCEHGAVAVVVSRAADPTLALLDDALYEVHVPNLQPGTASGDDVRLLADRVELCRIEG